MYVPNMHLFKRLKCSLVRWCKPDRQHVGRRDGLLGGMASFMRSQELAPLRFEVGVTDTVDDRDGRHGGENPERGGHGSPAVEEGAEDDEDDALGSLHETDF